MSENLFTKLLKFKENYIKLLNQPANYYLLSHHGFINLVPIETQNLKKVPNTISLYFTSPIGCQVSNFQNQTTINFYKNKVFNFVNNPSMFLRNKNKHLTNNLIIYPPGSTYIDMYIDITIPKNNNFGMYSIQKYKNFKSILFNEKIKTKEI